MLARLANLAMYLPNHLYVVGNWRDERHVQVDTLALEWQSANTCLASGGLLPSGAAE